MSKDDPIDAATRERIEVDLELDRWRERQSGSREGAYAETLREELGHLWSDLAVAYRMSRANPPEKSQECEGLIERIWAITDLVGPCPSGRISMPFLLTGMYEKVHAEIGVTVTVPEETLQAAREYVAKAKRMTA